MKWCSHCMKSVNIDYVIGTECTFWSCADCSKILGSVCMIGGGQKRRLKRAIRTPEESRKRNHCEDDRIFFDRGRRSIYYPPDRFRQEKKTQRGQKNHNEND